MNEFTFTNLKVKDVAVVYKDDKVIFTDVCMPVPGKHCKQIRIRVWHGASIKEGYRFAKGVIISCVATFDGVSTRPGTNGKLTRKVYMFRASIIIIGGK